MKWATLQIIENLTKKRMKGMKPATAAEAFQAKKQVALKKIERDFEDEKIRTNFEKFGKDARKLAAEFTPEELAMYILSLTVQDPDSLPEVEIAREKPFPFKTIWWWLWWERQRGPWKWPSWRPTP